MNNFIKVLTKFLSNAIGLIILLGIGFFFVLYFQLNNRDKWTEKNLSRIWINIENDSFDSKVLISLKLNGKIIFHDSVQGRKVEKVYADLKIDNNVLEATYNQFAYRTDTLSAKSKWKEYALSFTVSPAILENQAILNNVLYFYPYRGVD